MDFLDDYFGYRFMTEENVIDEGVAAYERGETEFTFDASLFDDYQIEYIKEQIRIRTGN